MKKWLYTQQTLHAIIYVTELTVPAELGGFQVRFIDYAAIPRSVKTIHLPKNCQILAEDEPIRKSLKIVE